MPATLPPGFRLGVEITCRIYKPRDPRKTSLYGLLDSLYDRVKGVWEERFERSYGFWRGLVDEVVAGYLACGVWQVRIPAVVSGDSGDVSTGYEAVGAKRR
jgi:hypothetical protein